MMRYSWWGHIARPADEVLELMLAPSESGAADLVPGDLVVDADRRTLHFSEESRQASVAGTARLGDSEELGGTELEIELQVRVHGVVRLAWPVVRGAFRRRIAESFEAMAADLAQRELPGAPVR